MSVKLQFKSTNAEKRKQIVKDLTFESKDNYTKRSNYLYAFDTDPESIYVPINYAAQAGIKVNVDDEYPNADMVFTGSLRPIQEQLAPEVLDILRQSHACTISAGCGLGKTIMAIHVATVLKLKTLVVLFNKLMLVEQWDESIKKVTGSTVQFLKAKSVIDMSNDFFIINAINIPKFGRVFGDMGLCICDECHLAATPVGCRALQHITPKYLLGLSATPFRLDGLSGFLRAYFGTPIEKSQARKHTVHVIQTGIKLKYERNYDGTLDWNSVLNSQAMNEQRNKAIVNLICRFSDRVFLVLARRVEQAEYLTNMLKEKGVTTDILTGTKTKYDKTVRVLISTSQKAGIGFDNQYINALLMAGDVESYYVQYLGRVLARSAIEPLVFDFVDEAPKTLMKHFMTRKKVYEDCGGVIKIC